MPRIRVNLPGPQLRQGMALPLVVVLLAGVFLVLGATSYFRATVTRRLSAASFRQELARAAETSALEIAQENRIENILRDSSAEVIAAFQSGDLTGGILAPVPVPMEAQPTETIASLEATSSIAVSPVQVILTRYMPQRGRGTLRLIGEARATVSGSERVSRVGLDFEFSIFDIGGQLSTLIAPQPIARVYQ